ncbi:PP2C family protein-serine/threonine phosphatase [Streptomyces anulatus]|uniref:PP2C family protein-serine/threonine phosphatase n=1 Tax=Streptomyces anulatus TaxID=1892 RepID=UPI0036554FF3
MKNPGDEVAGLNRWLPWAAMGAVLLADRITGEDYGLMPVFAVGPALAAAAGPSTRVVRVSAAALLLCAATVVFNGRIDPVGFSIALVAVVVLTVAAWFVATSRLRTENELTDVKAVADAMQQVLLGPVPARTSNGRLAVSYVSAVESARVGGDLYEAMPLPAGGVRIIVADVQGKGLPAVRTTSVVLAAFRESAPYVDRLAEVGRRIERSLNWYTDGERFVTAVLAEIADDGSVDILNYGHPSPVVHRGDGLLEPADPETPGPPLGLGSLTDVDPGHRQISLVADDRILFHTDGLTEARNSSGTFYPILDRIGGPLSEPDPQNALDRLHQDVARFTEGLLNDDSALLLFQYGPDDEHVPRG